MCIFSFSISFLYRELQVFSSLFGTFKQCIILITKDYISVVMMLVHGLLLCEFISAYPNILDISSDSFSSNFFSSSNITELGVSGVYL